MNGMLIYFVTIKNLKHKYNLNLHFSFPAIQFLVVHSHKMQVRILYKWRKHEWSLSFGPSSMGINQNFQRRNFEKNLLFCSSFFSLFSLLSVSFSLSPSFLNYIMLYLMNSRFSVSDCSKNDNH